MGNHKITQAQFMRMYNETHREKFNPLFFQRSNQEIMDCMKKVILSCERDKYFTLKVLDMREIYDYEEIYNILKNHDEKRRKKNSKADNPYDYIDVKDSDIMLLEVKYFIRHNGTELQKDDAGNDIVVNNPCEILTVLIALPRFSKKYYFRLNGNYYSDIFQIVDGSTYNNANNGGGGKTKKVPCNTFKTMFTPIRIFRMYKDMMDVMSKSPIRNTVYTSIIFSNHVNTMFYIFANFGFYGAEDFLDIHCIQVNSEPIMDTKWYNFEKNGIYISYPKECGQDPMVQSFAVTIYEAIQKDTKLDDIFDIRFWILNLGRSFANASIDKGLFILDSIDGTYDIITKEELHLPEEYKQNIYEVLRWLMREFGYLRKKNNVDVSLKRLRIGEPIAAIYAAKLSSAIYSLSDSGKKVTLQAVKRRIYTNPMYVLNNLVNQSNLVAYRDLVNDDDATLALKYTYKGISGLGENGASIQQSYRYVDPSHAGIVDLDSSTTSDPGMSGTICPMAKVYNRNSFSEYQEPNFWEEKYKKYQTDFFKKNYPNETKPVTFEKEPEKDYYSLRQKVIQESLDIDRVTCPIYNTEDSTIDYSNIGKQLQKEKESESHIQSLFTIKKDYPKEHKDIVDDIDIDYDNEDAD
jgi:hypothetical protein